MKDPGEETEDDMVPFLNSCLTWARLTILYFPAQLFLGISFLLSLSQRVPKSFLEHQICRMLIDVTWKKEFWVKQISLLLGFFLRFPGVCGVNLWEGDVVCSVSQAYVPCMNLLLPPPPPNLSSILFVCLLNQVSGRLIFFRCTVWEVRKMIFEISKLYLLFIRLGSDHLE